MARSKKEPFNIGYAIGVAIIGLLASLLGSGILAMFTLYSRQATSTEQIRTIGDAVKTTNEVLAKHLDKSIDRDDYQHRDQQIQKALDHMASKDELKEVQHSIDQQSEAIHTLQELMLNARASRR